MSSPTKKRALIIEEYLPPSILEHLPEFEEALKRLLDLDLTVKGDLNTDIRHTHNPRSQKVTGLLMKFGLIDLLLHLHQRWNFRYMKTWSQVRQEEVMRAIYDYILSTTWRHFKMVVIKGVSNYPSYHFAQWARILISPP